MNNLGANPKFHPSPKSRCGLQGTCCRRGFLEELRLSPAHRHAPACKHRPVGVAFASRSSLPCTQADHAGKASFSTLMTSLPICPGSLWVLALSTLIFHLFGYTVLSLFSFQLSHRELQSDRDILWLNFRRTKVYYPQSMSLLPPYPTPACLF